MRGKNVARVRRLHSERDAIAYLRQIVTDGIETRAHARPQWNGVPVTITLTNPRKNQTREATLKAWGIPSVMDHLEGLVHHSRGGWGVLELPPMVEVYTWLAKAARRADAILYLDLLARASLHSQLTLSEALSLVVECARITPIASPHPRETANQWASVAIHAVNVWQARHEAGGAGIGDETALAERVYLLRDMCAQWQVDQLELDLERRRADLRSRGVAA